MTKNDYTLKLSDQLVALLDAVKAMRATVDLRLLTGGTPFGVATRDLFVTAKLVETGMDVNKLSDVDLVAAGGVA